jgi:hypothetical protein
MSSLRKASNQLVVKVLTEAEMPTAQWLRLLTC